jgi:hypothetical protein
MGEEHMKVEVDYEYHTKSRGWEWKRGGYAYETDLDLKVGEVVVVPSRSEARMSLLMLGQAVPAARPAGSTAPA